MGPHHACALSSASLSHCIPESRGGYSHRSHGRSHVGEKLYYISHEPVGQYGAPAIPFAFQSLVKSEESLTLEALGVSEKIGLIYAEV